MHPHFLWLLLVIPIALFWHYFIKNQQDVALKMSTTEGLSTKKSLLIQLRPFLYVLKLLALGFIIIALARPRNTQKSSYTESTKLLVRSTMKRMIEALPGGVFQQVHKSYLINLEKIEMIGGNRIIVGRHTVPVARNFREEVSARILKNTL
jgi:hypothetical protein